MLNFEKVMKIRLTLTEEILGTMPGSKDIYEKYIASKAPKQELMEEEVEDFDPDKMLDEAMTGFPRTDKGEPFIYGYQVLGFLKAAARAMSPIKSSITNKKKAYIKEIDTRIKIEPRQIPISFKGFLGVCQRPLRANTPQGERVALAISETCPAGSTLDITISLLDKNSEDLVREWLDYGELHGLGQWRNSGKGSFVWEELDENGKVIGGNKT